MKLYQKGEITVKNVYNGGRDYIAEIIEIIRSGASGEVIAEKLFDYHDSDVADALTELTSDERKRLYRELGEERFSEIFAYVEDAEPYIIELGLRNAAKIIENMDSDDAVDILDDIGDEIEEKLVKLLDRETSRDIKLIRSYEDDEIGSLMTTNYVSIKKGLTVKQAMRELIRQAGDNDNISTLYVCDDDGIFYGAIDLKNLITAREHDELEDIIGRSYPYVSAHENISECIERIRDYTEDSFPVLGDDGRILGIITSQDILEAVDDELGDDYAKLAGLSEEEDVKESVFESVRKRLPWLAILLVLGIGVSAVVGAFEAVVAELAVIVCFQSLILGMAGNAGTQSLAVTIRVLMDEQLGARERAELVLKELRVGFFNGLLLGAISFAVVGAYVALVKDYTVLEAFAVSGCVGLALLVSIVISSLVGTSVPLLFHRLKIDPAVASGPLITTVNDLVAVITYYGLAFVLLINTLHITG